MECDIISLWNIEKNWKPGYEHRIVMRTWPMNLIRFRCRKVGVRCSVSAIRGSRWVLDCIFITVWVGFPRPKSLWNKPEYKCYVPPASLSRLKSSCSEKMFPLLQKSISANSRGNLNCLMLVSSLKERKIKILIPCSMRMNNKILATDLWLSSYRKLLCLLPWANWITMLFVSWKNINFS